jgi:tetratricopeptide (TPR) repeat protein
MIAPIPQRTVVTSVVTLVRSGFIGALLCAVGCTGSRGVVPPDPSEGTVAMDVANAAKGSVGEDVAKSSSSMHHFLVGQLAYVAEDFDSALQNFKQASELAQEPAPLVHSRLAELNLRFGNVDEALENAKRAVAEEPNEPYARLLYAGILEGLGRENEAAPLYRQLISEFPDKFDAYILLSNSYIKRKEFDEAVLVLQELLKRHPQEVLARYYLGQAYEKAGKLDQAETEYQSVVDSEAGKGTGAPDLLRVFLLQKKAEKAKALCNQMLAKDPNNVLARKALGHFMLGESNFDAALEHLRVLEKVEEDSSDTRFKIALIQIEKQNFKEAIRELNLVLAKNPEHDEARYYLASMYAGGGRRKEAVKELQEVKRSSNIFVKSRTFLAFVLRQDQEFKAAEVAVRDALEVEPNNPNIVLYLVLVLRDQQRYSDAAEILQGALKQDPKNERYVFNLALVNHDLGNEDETVRLMGKTIELNPANSDALNYLAYSIIERGGDLVKAESYVKEALRIRPDDSFYLDTLGWLQFKTNRSSEAQETLARAVTNSSEDLVIVEHYVAVLIANGKVELAASIIKSALSKADPKDNSDREKTEARARIERVYGKLLEENPHLNSGVKVPQVGKEDVGVK